MSMLIYFCRLDVFVYYDDLFNEQFPNSAKTRVAAIMSIVQNMYSKKDTLKTKIDVKLVGNEHMPGENWGNTPWR